MVDKTSRALRRHHRARMQKRAKIIYKDWLTACEHWSDNQLKRWVGRLRDNLKICSCSMCGNPRRSGWLNKQDAGTMQERKEDERFKYEMLEVDNFDDI